MAQKVSLIRQLVIYKERNIQNFIKAFSWYFSLSLFMRVLIRNEMVFMWVLETLYSLIGNWLRDHTSWALSGIGVKIKSFPKNFWSSFLNFTASRYGFFFSNSETYIVHVINCEVDSLIFPLHNMYFPSLSSCHHILSKALTINQGRNISMERFKWHMIASIH